MNLKVLKLRSGEDLISQVEDDGFYWALTDPMRIVPVTSPAGQLKFVMMPWFPFTKDKQLNVSKDEVVLICEPHDDIQNGYREQFGGIVTASQGLVVPQ